MVMKAAVPSFIGWALDKPSTIQADLLLQDWDL